MLILLFQLRYQIIPATRAVHSVLYTEAAKLAEQYNMPVEQVKAIIPVEGLKKDLALRKASELVISSEQAGEDVVGPLAPVGLLYYIGN